MYVKSRFLPHYQFPARLTAGGYAFTASAAADVVAACVDCKLARPCLWWEGKTLMFSDGKTVKVCERVWAVDMSIDVLIPGFDWTPVAEVTK